MLSQTRESMKAKTEPEAQHNKVKKEINYLPYSCQFQNS